MNPDTDENRDRVLKEKNPESSTLFDRVVSIIEQARAHTVRSLDTAAFIYDEFATHWVLNSKRHYLRAILQYGKGSHCFERTDQPVSRPRLPEADPKCHADGFCIGAGTFTRRTTL